MHLKSRLNRATAMIFLSKHLGQQAGRIYHTVSPSFAIEIFKNPVLLSEQVSLSFTITLCGTQSHLLFSRHLVLTPNLLIETSFEVKSCSVYASFSSYSINLFIETAGFSLRKRDWTSIQFLLHQPTH